MIDSSQSLSLTMLVANVSCACVDLQQSKSSHHRAILYVTGDALRVVDEISKVRLVFHFQLMFGGCYSISTFSQHKFHFC